MLRLFFQLKMMESLQFIATMYDELMASVGTSTADVTSAPPIRQEIEAKLTSVKAGILANPDVNILPGLKSTLEQSAPASRIPIPTSDLNIISGRAANRLSQISQGVAASTIQTQPLSTAESSQASSGVTQAKTAPEVISPTATPPAPPAPPSAVSAGLLHNEMIYNFGQHGSGHTNPKFMNRSDGHGDFFYRAQEGPAYYLLKRRELEPDFFGLNFGIVDLVHGTMDAETSAMKHFYALQVLTEKYPHDLTQGYRARLEYVNSLGEVILTFHSLPSYFFNADLTVNETETNGQIPEGFIFTGQGNEITIVSQRLQEINKTVAPNIENVRIIIDNGGELYNPILNQPIRYEFDKTGFIELNAPGWGPLSGGTVSISSFEIVVQEYGDDTAVVQLNAKAGNSWDDGQVNSGDLVFSHRIFVDAAGTFWVDKDWRTYVFEMRTHPDNPSVPLFEKVELFYHAFAPDGRKIAPTDSVYSSVRMTDNNYAMGQLEFGSQADRRNIDWSVFNELCFAMRPSLYYEYQYHIDHGRPDTLAYKSLLSRNVGSGVPLPETPPLSVTDDLGTGYKRVTDVFGTPGDASPGIMAPTMNITDPILMEVYAYPDLTSKKVKFTVQGMDFGTFIYYNQTWYVQDETKYHNIAKFTAPNDTVRLVPHFYKDTPPDEFDFNGELMITNDITTGDTNITVTHDMSVSVPVGFLEHGFWSFKHEKGGMGPSLYSPFKSASDEYAEYDVSSWTKLENGFINGTMQRVRYDDQQIVEYQTSRPIFANGSNEGLKVVYQEYDDATRLVSFYETSSDYLLTSYAFKYNETAFEWRVDVGGDFQLWNMASSYNSIDVTFEAYNSAGAAYVNAIMLINDYEHNENIETLYGSYLKGAIENSGGTINPSQHVLHGSTYQFPVAQIMNSRFDFSVNNSHTNLYRPLTGDPIGVRDALSSYKKMTRQILIEFENNRFLRIYGLNNDFATNDGVPSMLVNPAAKSLLTEFEIEYPTSTQANQTLRSTPQTRPLNINANEIDVVYWVSTEQTHKLIIDDEEITAPNALGNSWYGEFAGWTHDENLVMEKVYNALIYCGEKLKLNINGKRYMVPSRATGFPVSIEVPEPEPETTWFGPYEYKNDLVAQQNITPMNGGVIDLDAIYIEVQRHSDWTQVLSFKYRISEGVFGMLNQFIRLSGASDWTVNQTYNPHTTWTLGNVISSDGLIAVHFEAKDHLGVQIPDATCDFGFEPAGDIVQGVATRMHPVYVKSVTELYCNYPDLDGDGNVVGSVGFLVINSNTNNSLTLIERITP